MIDNDSNALQMIKKIQNYMFDLNHIIGEGSFSQVYQGTDIIKNTSVAVKRVRVGDIRSKIATRLLQHEISILKIVDHPNIIKCLDVHTSINNCYIIMELCEEGDLDSELKKRKLFSEEETSKIIFSVFKALQYMSNLHIIHRDLKVSNIFLHKGIYKLGDFGFAIRANQIFKDIAIGSPVYMSPEGLISNLYGPKTDVWSFGLLAYELLHGTTPLVCCKSEQQLKKKVLQAPLLRKDISEDLKQLILNCLKVNEKERYSVKQISQSAYIKRIKRQLDTKMEIQKDLTLTVNSTQASMSEISPLVFPSVSYDVAVSLIHYCRLIHKVLVMSSSQSQTLSKYLIWISFNLARSQLLMNEISQEKQANLRDVIRQYNQKYVTAYGFSMIDTISYEQICNECERKIQKQPKLSSHLRIICKESQLLLHCLQSGCMELFGKRSKAKQFMNTITRQ